MEIRSLIITVLLSLKASHCEIFITSAPEAQRNLKMCMPTVKIEIKEETIIESRDEEETRSSEYMCPFAPPLESSNFINYYDSASVVFEEMKKEFPEHECPQSGHNKNNDTVSEVYKMSRVTTGRPRGRPRTRGRRRPLEPVTERRRRKNISLEQRQLQLQRKREAERKRRQDKYNARQKELLQDTNFVSTTYLLSLQQNINATL